MITPLPLTSTVAAAALSGRQRSRLAALADVLIPGDTIMPSASSVDTQHGLIDRALAARPDLQSALELVLAVVPDTEDIDAIRRAADRFAEANPDTFNAFGQLLKGAYFLDPGVRTSIGYPGQEARPLVDDTDAYFEILGEVVERGEFFRPTPVPRE